MLPATTMITHMQIFQSLGIENPNKKAEGQTAANLMSPGNSMLVRLKTDPYLQKLIEVICCNIKTRF